MKHKGKTGHKANSRANPKAMKRYKGGGKAYMRKPVKSKLRR